MDFTKLTFETESDVEQKFVYNLLTNKNPLGLGYPHSQIKTKPDIRKIKIDKGIAAKLYYPDYVILSNGLPVIIIEAKSPFEDIAEGFREARLYANEINASFPSKINPCKYIISTNGILMHCGYWDGDKLKFVIEQSNFSIANSEFMNFLDELSYLSLEDFILRIKTEFRGGTRF